jgi:Ca2+-transporting ATPase
VSDPWTGDTDRIIESLEVDPEQGLSTEEAKRRLEEYGPNRIAASRRRSAREIFFDQIKNLIVVLLMVAAAAAFAFGQGLEGVAIVIALLINVLVGFFTELRAVRSMEALEKMSEITANVLRDGETVTVPAPQVVPGDVAPLDGGDVAPADMRLIEANSLKTDESALTGESVPVSKKVGDIEEDAPLAERWNMVFKGTGVTDGTGRAVVVSTGMETELGRISRMAQEAEEEESPLEKRLEDLGKDLVWITLAIAAAVAVIGWFRGQHPLLILETSIALAVAAIPEGLPVVATIALARGLFRMAKRNAVINRLSAVETLGATNVIFTDKTGTLTKNRMDVNTLILPQGDAAREIEFTGEEISGDVREDDLLGRALYSMVLCNNADLSEDPGTRGVGDPMELALLEAGRKAGLRREELLEDMPEVREVAFDAETKMMATFHESGDGYLVAVKGAPESVIEACAKIATPDGEREMADADKERWYEKNRETAERGLRLLALAGRRAGGAEEDPYEGMIFFGMVGMYDPPAEGVEEAVRELHKAGLKIVMVTGDHPDTARGIGGAIGLRLERGRDVMTYRDLKGLDGMDCDDREDVCTTSIFARVTPKQKLDLIDLFKSDGRIVAMTGDGVNDAPALKKADIGVAMGLRGTQVAREASDMILKDDEFSSIAAAVEEGRAIFDNIRKFIIFLLSGNVGEIMIVAAALMIGWGLPLLPLQILYLNMLGDVFPALALGLGEGGPEIMKRPPRDPAEPIMARTHWILTVVYGAVIAVVVLAAFKLAGPVLGAGSGEAVSTSFLTLSFARIWHTFNMRDTNSGLIDNGVVRNKYVWGAVALCVALLVLAVYASPLAYALDIVQPGADGWAFILGMSLVPFILVQGAKIALRNKVKNAD